ncbi:UDP-4-amino-4,6-dideoxy-N-acetyl-beta-L-altrosamine transaminase [Tepidibacter sp. Z1-5]|uniref:UDP-4-amino-4, 6-dideoxy-N-acetyl-beta-L-altrosamine transaminase n=1 Tax=Tepidibacter sp. Z1-5 TaxID=3134138 RepID=UPI0030BB1403
MTLAINGGSPVRKSYLPYGKQCIEEDDIKAVVEVLNSDYLTTGPKVLEFEEKLKNYVGSKYAVAVQNGTAALHLAVMALNLEKGDEVITTPMTFAASSNCILYCGLKPVFVDINKENYNIDINLIESKITKKTKAIIPVDFTGQAVDMDSIMCIADQYNLKVIEDAAHSIGSKYKGKMVGSLSHMTTFSFHPVKTITTGEGGGITTNDKDFYEKLLLFRSHGITRNKEWLGNKEEGSWYYEQLEIGYNYRITDIQCALGISQLDKIDKFIKRRKEIVKIYNCELSKIDGVILQKEESFSDTCNHLYIIRLELDKFSATRNEIFNALKAENIGVNLHYIPVYYHPFYKNLRYEKGICPHAESLYESIITLPLHYSMIDQDIFDVIEAVNKVLGYYRN